MANTQLKIKGLIKSLDKNFTTDYQSYQIEKIAPYFYSINFYDWDYEVGQEYLSKYKHGIGGCTSFRHGNYFGRNYDWYYDNGVEFLIHCHATKGRHASLGMASISSITEDMMTRGEETNAFAILPFITLDGMNDQGVYASMNVVPVGDKGYTLGTNPEGESLGGFSMVRFVLDYADSAADAVARLSDRNIWGPLLMGYDLHLLVADANDTFIVEFVDNAMNVIDKDHMPNDIALMTNFHLSGWSGDAITVPLGSTEEEVRAAGVTPYGAGFERYNLIKDDVAAIASEADTLAALKKVKYSNTYTAEQPWLSELVGTYTTVKSVTNYSPAEDYDEVLLYALEKFDAHERDSSLWITVHSSIYDIPNKKLTVYVQEDYEHPFYFALKAPGTREA